MIFITGDTHGSFKLRTLYVKDNFKDLTKDDYLIILGDFGGLWEGTEIEQKDTIDFFESLPFTTLFIDGNHENFTALNSFEVTRWNGGKVHRISNSLIHLMRGQVFTIGGKTFFTFGGAQSMDCGPFGPIDMDDVDYYMKVHTCESLMSHYRIKNYSWWAEELPTNEEIKEGFENLQRYNNKVNFILTHDFVSSWIKYKYGAGAHVDQLTNFLQKVYDTVEYDEWYFGHYHINERLRSHKAKCIYKDIDAFV